VVTWKFKFGGGVRLGVKVAEVERDNVPLTDILGKTELVCDTEFDNVFDNVTDGLTEGINIFAAKKYAHRGLWFM
jgi:hypothetical protein